MQYEGMARTGIEELENNVNLHEDIRSETSLVINKGMYND